MDTECTAGSIPGNFDGSPQLLNIPADSSVMTELRITSTSHSPTNVIGWRLAPDAITRRETEVLQAITDGCSTPQIAARLYLSQKTVKNHLASIYQKLDARDRTQAVLIALRLGIVQLERSDAA
jgi:DNA-binding NarL/FixJ family response regulator